MTIPDDERSTSRSDLFGLLAQRWWVLLLATVLGIGAGWYAADQRPRTYTSTTQVLVSPISTNPRAEAPNLDTEAQLVKAAHTAERARSLLDEVKPTVALARQVAVQVPANTQILEISFAATTPVQARRGAAAFARAYLELRFEEIGRDTEERIATLSERIAQLRSENASHQVIVALESEQALLQAQPVRAGEIISPATTPAAPTSPNVRMFILSGMVAGLLLGLSAALLIQRLDTRISRAADLPASLRAQVLLAPPVWIRPGIAAATTMLGRELTKLRNVLLARDRPGPPEVWLLCGVKSSAVTGVTTANLAAALARTGSQVAVIAGDPASSVFPALGVPRSSEHGMSQVFVGKVPAAEALLPALTAPGVAVLSPGTPSPVELLVPELTKVISQLTSKVDYLLIETPPLSQSMDAQALACLSSLLLLVAECRATKVTEVATAMHDLTQVHAPVAGILLAPPQRRWPSIWPRRGRRSVPEPPR